MDELVELVAKKANIDEKSAKIAVKTVLDYLKKNIPEPYASQLDSLLEGGGQTSDLLGSLGGLMGKK